jgi:hypothetical protein
LNARPTHASGATAGDGAKVSLASLAGETARRERRAEGLVMSLLALGAGSALVVAFGGDKIVGSFVTAMAGWTGIMFG